MHFPARRGVDELYFQALCKGARVVGEGLHKYISESSLLPLLCGPRARICEPGLEPELVKLIFKRAPRGKCRWGRVLRDEGPEVQHNRIGGHFHSAIPLWL